MLTAVRPRARPAAAAPSNPRDALVRARMSAHLAGLALVPTVAVLAELGAVRVLRQAGDVSADSVASRVAADPAWLGVALRLLAGCGWLDEHQATDRHGSFFRLTPAGREACDVAPQWFRGAAALLAAVADLPMAFSDDRGDEMIAAMRELAGLGAAIEGRHGVDGARLVAGPVHSLGVVAAMVTLARAGIIDLLDQGPLRLLAIDDLLQVLLDRLVAEQWLAPGGGTLQLTPAGRTAVGMAPPCLELWAHVPLLLSPGAAGGAAGAPEESLHVAGRGGAFRTWPDPLDEVLLDLFNRPVPQQPRGICDVSCGSGELLEHAYRLIRDRTARGRVLKEHPLLVLGADESRLARETAGRVLRAAGVPRHHVAAASAGDPASIAEEAARHSIALRDLVPLHVFAGIAAGDAPGEAPREAIARRLTRWLPYVSRFGMVVVERHPRSPGDAGPDTTGATAYDAVLGYAGHARCDAGLLVDAARSAGLDRHPRFRAQFPASAAPVVSCGYFLVAGRTHA